MTIHAAPFESWRNLPADLGRGAWIVYGTLLGAAWEAISPRLLGLIPDDDLSLVFPPPQQKRSH